MTYRVKVSKEGGPKYYYALNEASLEALFECIFADGPVPTFLTVLP